MIALVSGIISVILYSAGFFLLSRNLSASTSKPVYQREQILLCTLMAVIAHLLNVQQIIITPTGYDFSFYKVSTLFSWSIITLVLISCLKKPLENLFLILFPLAILSIIVALSLGSSVDPRADYSAGVASHILLGILSVSIITIAAIQAIFIAYQNRQLKNRQSFGLISHLPPLQTMEALLFEFVWVGLLLLSGVIITGALFMEDFLGQHLSRKTVLSIISWIVFAILLWGRHQWGWRGNTAIRWTLTGFAFLILAYFGSKFVLELILESV